MLLPVVCMLGPLLTVVERKPPMTLDFEIIVIIAGINKEAVPRHRKTSMEIRNEAAAAGAMEGNSIHCIVQYIEYLTVCTHIAT